MSDALIHLAAGLFGVAVGLTVAAVSDSDRWQARSARRALEAAQKAARRRSAALEAVLAQLRTAPLGSSGTFGIHWLLGIDAEGCQRRLRLIVTEDLRFEISLAYIDAQGDDVTVDIDADPSPREASTAEMAVELVEEWIDYIAHMDRARAELGDRFDAHDASIRWIIERENRIQGEVSDV